MSNIKFFVLDEADRMLDMGFQEEIKFFANAPGMPRKEQRQTLLFRCPLNNSFLWLLAALFSVYVNGVQSGNIVILTPLHFSATFPEEVQQIAKEYLKSDYQFITVGVVGAAQTDVTQIVENVDFRSKTPRVKELLNEIGM